MNLTKEQKIAKFKLLKEKRRRSAKHNILEFTRYTMPEYRVNWHHRDYCKKIDAFIKGDIKNLMVFIGPQHGKSEISTRRTPAQLLGIYPDKKVGIVAYNHTIAAKFNRDIQRIIDSEEYRNVFPNTNLNNSNVRTTGTYLRNADEFEIVGHKGSLVSVGVGGGLTSRKRDIAIMDDLYKDAADAWSHTIREKVQDWYNSVLKTRLHNNSQQLLVFTRWHEEDLGGYLLRTEPEKWEIVIYEAIKETNREDDPREIGEALWPEQHSLETLLDIRKKNPIIFDSLYQQNPTPKEGLLLPESDLNRFKLSQLQSEPDTKIAVCDIADEGSDSLCQPIGYVYGNDIYVTDVIFTKDPIEVTQPRVAAMLDEYGISKARFESNNGGKGYAQKVKELKQGRTTIDWKHTSQNKHTKIIMNSGSVKHNFYFRDDIDNHPEYKQFMYELTHYPKNGKVKHDDAADAITMMNEFISKSSGIKFLK